MPLRPVLLALLFALALPSAHAAQEACELKLRPVNFLSQLDRRLEQAGLWHDGRSSLCGPTCALNALNIQRSLKGLPSPDPIQEMTSFIAALERQYADAHLGQDPRTGTNNTVMVELIRKAFGEAGIPVEVEGRVVIPGFYSEEREGSVTLDDFPENEHELTLIAVHGGPKEDGIGQTLAYQPQLAHWMLVIAANPADRSLTVVDPFKPDVPIQAKLEPLADRTFSVEFDRPLLSDYKDLVYFINGVITIRPKK